MDVNWNFLRMGLASSLCLALLAACADNRTANGFKSYRATEEERLAWLQKNKTSDNRNNINPPDKTPAKTPSVDSQTTTGGQGSPDQGKTQNTSAGRSDQNLVTSQAQLLRSPDEGTREKIKTELGEHAPQEEEQTRVSKRNDLVVANDFSLNKGVDQSAVNLVLGIDLVVDGSLQAKDLMIRQLDAVVVIEGIKHTLHVSHAPIKTIGQDEVAPVQIVLKNLATGVKVPARDNVYVEASCRDEKCAQVYVRMTFKAKDQGKTSAVFLLELTDKGYHVVATNISEQGEAYKTFAQAQGGLSTESEAANNQDREMADQKRATRLRAEGFDADDGQGEISRMRQVRSAGATTAQPDHTAETSQKKYGLGAEILKRRQAKIKAKAAEAINAQTTVVGAVGKDKADLDAAAEAKAKAREIRK